MSEITCTETTDGRKYYFERKKEGRVQFAKPTKAQKKKTICKSMTLEYYPVQTRITVPTFTTEKSTGGLSKKVAQKLYREPSKDSCTAKFVCKDGHKSCASTMRGTCSHHKGILKKVPSKLNIKDVFGSDKSQKNTSGRLPSQMDRIKAVNDRRRERLNEFLKKREPEESEDEDVLFDQSDDDNVFAEGYQSDDNDNIFTSGFGSENDNALVKRYYQDVKYPEAVLQEPSSGCDKLDRYIRDHPENTLYFWAFTKGENGKVTQITKYLGALPITNLSKQLLPKVGTRAFDEYIYLLAATPSSQGILGQAVGFAGGMLGALVGAGPGVSEVPIEPLHPSELICAVDPNFHKKLMDLYNDGNRFTQKLPNYEWIYETQAFIDHMKNDVCVLTRYDGLERFCEDFVNVTNTIYFYEFDEATGQVVKELGSLPTKIKASWNPFSELIPNPDVKFDSARILKLYQTYEPTFSDVVTITDAMGVIDEEIVQRSSHVIKVFTQEAVDTNNLSGGCILRYPHMYGVKHLDGQRIIVSDPAGSPFGI